MEILEVCTQGGEEERDLNDAESGSHQKGTGSSQRSDAQNVDIPVPRARENRGNPGGFHPGTGSSQRSDEQNADIPVPRARENRGNPQGFHPSQCSTAPREANFRPGRVCTRFIGRQWSGRGCGDGCTFAHSWAELHPEVSPHERELASYFDA